MFRMRRVRSFHCTKMYPKALMCLSPLSGECLASFPHVLESSGYPPVPNPILESQLLQSFSWLAVIPILALEWSGLVPTALKPCVLQCGCKEPSGPISDFHFSRLSEVARSCPSAISEYRESACLLMTMNLICWPIFIPRQILEKGVSQYVGNLVSSESNPVSAPGRLNAFLFSQRSAS